MEVKDENLESNKLTKGQITTVSVSALSVALLGLNTPFSPFHSISTIQNIHTKFKNYI